MLMLFLHSILAQPLPFSSAAPRRISPSNIIVPQTRNFSPVAGVEVSGITVHVEIVDQVATTTMEIALTNRGGARLESQIIVPVPVGAVPRGFSFQGREAESTVELLTRDEARRAYDAIVASVRDPALLEFLGCNLIRSSVFPVEPRSGQKVRIIYEHLLPRDGDRVDFVLPRTESIDYRIPWNISVRIKSKNGIATVYSPSHNIKITRQGQSVIARVASEATTEPGPFRLSYLVQGNEVSATLLAYPDVKAGGGYFLLLAGAPARPPSSDQIKREVILVLDRSGSMAGEKIEQVRAAVLQVLEGLDDGETFNIIVYSEAVELFSPAPVVKTRETMQAVRTYLRDLRVRGGTNIHDALQEALRMRATPNALPLVIFLTDGLPTVGQTSEHTIRELVAKGNPHRRRVFTFGVGVDVNTPLLDKVALLSRATSTFVLPREDVEVKVGQVFQRLTGPVLAEPVLKIHSSDGAPAFGRVHELLPSRLPDLFEADQLLVFGRYTGDEPLVFELQGDSAGRKCSFRFKFDFDRATTRNAFVPRLWASRKIGVLTDAIRDLGADMGGGDPAADPRMRELVDEVIRLSKEFGILSEYTAFLAREGTDLAHTGAIFNEALQNFDSRAVKTRSGLDSVSQSSNNDFKRAQMVDNYRNKFYDAQMNAVEISTVQQINDRAFYKKGGRWIESSLVDEANPGRPRVVRFGSEEFRHLAERLAAENRQGAITLKGEILLRIDGENVLIR
jgi:Ca-activated chloride channel family protein